MSQNMDNHIAKMNTIHRMAWEQNDHWLDYNSPVCKEVFKNWKDDYVPSESLSNKDGYLYFTKLSNRIANEKRTFYKK